MIRKRRRPAISNYCSTLMASRKPIVSAAISINSCAAKTASGVSGNGSRRFRACCGTAFLKIMEVIDERDSTGCNGHRLQGKAHAAFGGQAAGGVDQRGVGRLCASAGL